MLQSLLVRIAKALDAAGLPYMVIGGQAVLAYGFTRLTDDIDLTLGVAPDRLAEVHHAIEGAGLKPLADDSFVAEALVLPCVDPSTSTRVDLIFSFAGYERVALDRTKVFELSGHDVRFASVEDVLIHKIVASRVHDLRDAEELLVRHERSIDQSYMTHWLTAFGEALDQDLVWEFKRLLEAARS
jgi:predicted nucleotidyltransferase